MLPIFVQEAVTSCGGYFLCGSKLSSDSLCISRISINSRSLDSGDFFIATPGDRFDGHDFLIAALDQGAMGAMVDESAFISRFGDPKAWLENLYPDRFLWIVQGARNALGSLAAYHRKRFPNLPIIAVAGSNGKTSTKEFLRHALSSLGPLVWSPASFNNDIGVPLTLVQLDVEHQVAIVEVGSNHPGELEGLLKMIRPTHALVTSIGREHLEFFKNIEGVIREEGETLLALEAGGKFWGPTEVEFWRSFSHQIPHGVNVEVNAPTDDPIPEKIEHFLPDVPLWKSTVLNRSASGTRFLLDPPADRQAYAGEYEIRSIGKHQVTNAVYAIAVGASLNICAERIRKNLEEGEGAPMRMKITESAGGILIINDAYNANVESMSAALQTLKDLETPGKKWAILGEMLELGDSSLSMHTEVGKLAAEIGLAGLWVVGKGAEPIATAAKTNGMQNVCFLENLDRLSQELEINLRPGDAVLLKASRGVKLERLMPDLEKL